MNDPMVFQNPQFGEIRAVDIDGEPWLVGKDVATALGYQNPSKALTDHVDTEDKLNNESLLSLGQRGGWLINESGLYSLILSSKLPTAKAFKRWVTSQVLPSIRKHGGYIAGQEGLSPDRLMAQALLVAKRTLDEQSARLSAMEVENRKLLAALSWGPPANLWLPSDLSYMLAYALAQGREDYITVLYLGYYAALAPSECFALETEEAARAVKSKRLTLPNQRTVPLNKLLIHRFRFHLPDGAGSRLLLRDSQSLYEAVSAFRDFLARYWPLASSGLGISNSCNGVAKQSPASLKNTLTNAPLSGAADPSMMDGQKEGR